MPIQFPSSRQPVQCEPHKVPQKSSNKVSPTDRLKASMIIGTPAALALHPATTAIKRIMNSSEAVNPSNLRATIAPGAKTTTEVIQSLFAGGALKAGYKMAQVPFRFVVPPVIKDLSKSVLPSDTAWEKVGISAISGALGGVTEAFTLGTVERSITYLQAGKNHNYSSLIKQIKKRPSFLFDGVKENAIRNATGSVMMWGVGDGVLLALGTNYKSAKLEEFVFANACGIGSSLAVSGPFDVIKTRLQMQSKLKEAPSIPKAFKDIVSKEGFAALWKGQLPKFGLNFINLMVVKTAIDKFAQTIAANNDKHLFKW